MALDFSQSVNKMDKKQIHSQLTKEASLSRLIEIRTYLKVRLTEVSEASTKESIDKFDDLLKEMDEEILDRMLRGETTDLSHLEM